jgi:hypothetical protein
MSERRLNSFSAKEHLSYRPSDGLVVPLRPQRGALGNASRAPESHAASRLSERRTESNDLTPIHVPTTEAALNALVRPGYGRSRARGRPGGWGVYREVDVLAWAQARSTGPRRSTSDPGTGGSGQEAA